MLRVLVAGLGFACIAGAVLLTLAIPQAWFVGLELFGLGALVLIGVFFERHYRGFHASTKTRLQQTGERFVDPTTGKLTEVLYDPQTGEREYRDA